MNAKLANKLAQLRDDYTATAGRPFLHFYCPILFRDEQVELVKGHVINQAYSNPSPKWTVQRRDVDNFFGAHFEADFVVLEERGKHDLFDVLGERSLSRKLKPRITVDGEEIAYYSPHDSVPEEHSSVLLERSGAGEVRLALKLNLDDMLSKLDGDWQVEIRRDLTVPVLVSLLKAAHLSLFTALGYNYALSAAGHFMGWDVLGKFYIECVGKQRDGILLHALEHFREFVNLTRPILRTPLDIAGTVDDGYLYICTGSPNPWAMLVFVKAGTDFHSVVVPVLEDSEGAARFYQFMRSPPPRFEIRLAKFAGDRWDVSTTAQVIEWPAASPEDLQIEV